MRHALVLATLSAVVLACDPPASELPGATAGSFDPQLVTIDAAAPHTRFGDEGSILLGAGWGVPEPGRRRRGEPPRLAWVTEKAAAIWFERPTAEDLDLVADCAPLSFPGAEPQTLTLRVGNRKLPPVEMSIGWQRMRIELPTRALPARGPVDLRMIFSRVVMPGKVGADRRDARRLAAACGLLAVVPRTLAEADVDPWLAAHRLEESGRRLSLAAGGTALLPLPAAADVKIRPGAVDDRCPSCELRVEVVEAGTERLLWKGPPAAAAGRELSLTTPDSALVRLRLTVDADGAPDPERLVDIELGTDFLRASERSRPQPERPHVFIYLIDTLRADALSPYGAEPDRTPHVAELAADAVVYREAWTASSWTLPATVSILTGVYPARHGIMQGNVKLSRKNVPTLAALLGGAGYDTLGLSQSFVASRHFGLHTGFDEFVLNNQLNGFTQSSQELRRHLYWRLLHRRHADSPVFAYLHTVDPHAPYAPQGADLRFARQHPAGLKENKYLPHVFIREGLGEDPGDIAHLRALYDGEVAFADRQLGSFLDMLRLLDLYDDSLIVVLSDHGEEFGEHGGFDHGRTVYEEMLRVPLIVKYPRSRWAGNVVEERVSTVDVVPTVLAEAGIVSETRLDGGTLAPPAVAERPARDRLVWSEVHPMGSELLAEVDYRALAIADLKCIESLNQTDQHGRPIPRWQAFALDRDPGEQQPLDPDSPAAKRCRQLVEGWWREHQADADEPGPATSDEALGELRALGYIE